MNASNSVVGGDGTTWDAAARHINDDLPLAVAGDEIWVSAGVYYPDRTLFDPFGAGDRNATFALKSNVKLLGGFVGGETSASQRDPSMNITILSGDIGVVGSHGDNSRSILTAINVDSLCVVDDFTIVNGNCSDGSPTSTNGAALGGGTFMSASNLQVIRCTFDQNFTRGGAAIGAIKFAPPPPPHCPGDANGDNIVDFDDISVVISNFGNACTPF